MCECGCSPCQCTTEVSAACEPLNSALNNFITILFGSVEKTVVDGQVVWTLPCNAEDGIPQVPREAGEALMCYIIRVAEEQAVNILANNANLATLNAAAAGGGSGTYRVVDSVTFDSGTGVLAYVYRNLTFTNGLLTAASSTSSTTITTAEACP